MHNLILSALIGAILGAVAAYMYYPYNESYQLIGALIGAIIVSVVCLVIKKKKETLFLVEPDSINRHYGGNNWIQHERDTTGFRPKVLRAEVDRMSLNPIAL